MSLLRDARSILRLLRPERGSYAVGLGALFLVNLSDVLAPVFMAVAVDLVQAGLTGGDPRTPQLLRLLGLDASQFTVGAAVVLFLGLQLSANAARYPMLMFTAVPSHRIGQDIRNRMVAHLLRLARPFYDRTKSGDLMSLAIADVQAIRMMLGPGILVGTDTVFLVTLVIGVMLTLSWQLTLVALIPLPLIALLTNRLSLAEFRRFEEVQADLAKLTERARESYAGARVVQGYGQEAFDRARFEAASWRHYLKNLALARVRALFDPTLDLMLGASRVLVLVYGGLRVLDGQLSLGTWVAFLFLVGFLAGPMIGFGWAVSLFQRGRASLGRIQRLLDEPIEIDSPAAPRSVNGPGDVTIRGLTFQHPARPTTEATGNPPADHGAGEHEPTPVLRDISLDIPSGTTLGVFGPVGCGKSTLCNLLVRVQDPPPGTVFLDGVDVRELDLDTLRRTIVLAPQDTWLFSDTVARNISLSLDRHEIEESARKAMIFEEISSLPQGWDTPLGERGVNLSGGQRQRIAIARAVAANPRVLVLDDCLSAVDARTEEAILHNLRDVFRGRTGIIVSHRVVAVSRCDRIVVLEDGRITDLGTHDELVARGGYYARMAAEQSLAEAAE